MQKPYSPHRRRRRRASLSSEPVKKAAQPKLKSPRLLRTRKTRYVHQSHKALAAARSCLLHHVNTPRSCPTTALELSQEGCFRPPGSARGPFTCYPRNHLVAIANTLLPASCSPCPLPFCCLTATCPYTYIDTYVRMDQYVSEKLGPSAVLWRERTVSKPNSRVASLSLLLRARFGASAYRPSSRPFPAAPRGGGGPPATGRGPPRGGEERGGGGEEGGR